MQDSYNYDNVFNKIISGAIPPKIVFEDEWLMAFYDVAPVSPLHILIIPKNHYISFADFTSKASNFEIAHFFQKVGEIAKEFDSEAQFRIISNNGSKVGQTVFHFHVHIIAKKELKNLI